MAGSAGRVRAVEDRLHRHRRWAADCTWEELLAELQPGSDTDGARFDVGIDSTVIRAHQHAAGAPNRAPKDVPVERLAVALDDYRSTRARSAKSPIKTRTGGSIELQEST